MPETKHFDNLDPQSLQQLADNIKNWGEDLGFQQVAIVKPNLDEASQRLRLWLDNCYQGSMDWMSEHGDKRYKIDKLVARTLRVISVRMDYLADEISNVPEQIQAGEHHGSFLSWTHLQTFSPSASGSYSHPATLLLYQESSE